MLFSIKYCQITTIALVRDGFGQTIIFRNRRLITMGWRRRY